MLGEVGPLSGKVVIDCTNAVERGMTLKYGHTTSSVEELQKRIPEARVFKSFNAQGAENLARPPNVDCFTPALTHSDKTGAAPSRRKKPRPPHAEVVRQLADACYPSIGLKLPSTMWSRSRLVASFFWLRLCSA